jgi:nucleoside 2-deoxyribosyltransferase
MTCPICSNADATNKQQIRDSIIVDCPQCGTFAIANTATYLLENPNNFENDRWKISAWINEFKPEFISSTELETALNSAKPSLHHRAERMLRWIASKYPAGTEFSISTLQHNKLKPIAHRFHNQPANAHQNQPTGASRLIPIGWNKSLAEMEYMIFEVLCNELKLLISQNNHDYQVSPKGLLYLEGRRESVSSVGFCAMWFSEEVLPLWKEVIEPAITAAGYEAMRIDSKQHNGKIDDEIMASIRASKFVVSDFTGSRGGVYYEAGFAHGLGLPVIFMCRESDLKDIHFDVRQYNCILWTPEKLEEAQSQLKNRILATLGQGPKLVP